MQWGPRGSWLRAAVCASLWMFGSACSDDSAAAGDGETDTADDPDDGTDEPTTPTVAGACSYESPFTQSAECREYAGDGWVVDDVEGACDQLNGELEASGRCSTDGLLGRCTLDQGAETTVVVFAYGEADSCEGQATGCEVFGGGEWNPEPVCDGSGGGGGGGGGGVFIQPTLECRDPVAGEPAGNGPDGQVCTWQSIAGCTEDGRRFSDYASCDVVRSQRPYYPVPPADGYDVPDPRMQDAEYVAELAWVKSQIEASGCVCCHTAADTPDGPSNWYIDAPGNWINTFKPSGLALGATWVDSVALGAYPAEDNNGFDRDISGIPSTDPERMRDFFIGELAHRGFRRDDFSDTPPFGGPLYDQIVYRPTACEDGEGVAGDGTITWAGGDARYLYVLATGADNPTVPPNLDLPDGTLWRVDVPSDGAPVTSESVVYGQTPGGLSQRFPASGDPAALVPGTEYYLYVTRDVGIPITRCLFTF